MEGEKLKSTRSHKRGKLKSEVRFGTSFRTNVVEDYLSGDTDQRLVAARHGISQSSLCLWIKAYLEQKETGMAKSPAKLQASHSAFQQPLADHQAELSRLKKELETEKLRTLALEELIEVAEVQFKVAIRKKSGAKQ